ncbi:hypothetical protein HK097_009392 [Rhizophlyctis rosea]|uniref:Lytic polysaccharide monooxygenase 9 n=1 Tax=Rhizophlyctis rosea TaxID=64517 RepID=A0AAD5S903_9FUNG|nr:hypothetical protein HK097_009392 [Rhizophlyctis rosea]
MKRLFISLLAFFTLVPNAIAYCARPAPAAPLLTTGVNKRDLTGARINYNPNGDYKTTKTTKSGATANPTTTWPSSKPKPTKLNNVTVTWYGFDDNCCPNETGLFGGTCIAFPGNPPRFHQEATETFGTYDDPQTFAAAPEQFPPGTIIYYRAVQKYFIMEDECGECVEEATQGIFHVDFWVGPQRGTNGTVFCCENALTPDGPDTIIVNPPPHLPVNTESLFTCACILTGLIQDAMCAVTQTGGVCA